VTGLRQVHFQWLITVVLFMVFTPDGLSQSTLSGSITDKQSAEPIPYANIYFAHTTLGTSTRTDGTFVIGRIPNGKYDLMVEVVGYQRHKQPLEFQDGQYNIEIALVQDTLLLDSIQVIADQSDKKYFPVFFRFFAGQGENAKGCTIQNPEVLHFYFDEKKSYLTVHARKPISVINPELGYTVHYTLERFGLDFLTGDKIIEGSPRFEEIPVLSRKDSSSRQKKRNQAYRGSLLHFMRSLYGNTLDQEKFLTRIADSTAIMENEEKLLPFETAQYLSGGTIKHLQFTGLLKMEYRKDEELEYPGRGINRLKNPKGYQQTYLRMRDASIDIYENGYYADQKSIYLTGYLVWKETVCNMVPLGHEVLTKKAKKKR
jgi:hypothetical protein